MKKLVLILAIFLIIPFVSSYTINANETFTIDLTEILNVSADTINDTEIIVNVIHPFCNTTLNCSFCNISLTCPICPENQTGLVNSLNAQITNLNSKITNLTTDLLIAQNNISFYQMQISNLTSEVAKKESIINNWLTNRSYECPVFPPIPACPACPVCTIPTLPSLTCPNVTCPSPQVIMPDTNKEETKPSKAPWVISGVLFVMLVITFINLTKKNETKEEPVSEEFSEEFG